MLICDVAVDHLIVVEADCCDVEELDVVLEGDPERAIVLVLQVDLALGRLSPLGRLVTPVSLPLLVAPRVADLNDALRLSVV